MVSFFVKFKNAKLLTVKESFLIKKTTKVKFKQSKSKHIYYYLTKNPKIGVKKYRKTL